MTDTLQIWNALVGAAQALGPFADVRKCPLHKVADAEFFKALPDLKLPACLIVYRGGDDADAKRSSPWSAVLVFEDPAGEAWEPSVKALDLFRSQFVGQDLLDGHVWLKHTCAVAAVPSDPLYCIYEVTFETLEALGRMAS